MLISAFRKAGPGTGPGPRLAGMEDGENEDLSTRLAAIARALDTGSAHDTLQLIVDLAVATVPGCEHAGISFVRRRKISTPAASDAVALRVDAVQFEVGQGPCLDAIDVDRIFRSDDLATETRWPDFARRAHAETGVTSMLGVRLFARDRTIGALNLMSSKPSAFDDESLSTAALFAAMASVALNAAQTEETLQLALRSRDIIGQAMGILMERHRITDQEAFHRLSAASQNLNVRLKDVADQVVFTGEESQRQADATP
ncbi:GAF and ANTAR domain-containing protein [Pedococcus sp. KACC 23699]|uniref:GAF and ANTAR domain-containing protein n=1 Tax=Pedococcus sp. KACC 23699 TaxID=3149228 RepID=A0AAU7JQ24_9MICO